MKKFFILIITLVVSIVSLTTTTFATYIPVTNGNTGMWFTETRIDNENVHLVNFRVNQIWGDEKTDSKGFTSLFNTEFAAANTNKTYTLNVPSNQYTTLVVEKYNYTNQTNANAVKHYTGVVQSIKLVIDDYGYIYLKNQDNQIIFSDFDTYAIKVYFKTTILIPETEDLITYEELPLTQDGNLGIVLFSVSNYQATLTIWYDDVNYNLLYNFSPQTDMSLFTGNKEAYFINIDNNPQIYINQSDNMYLRDIITADSEQKPAFVPHVIWDLKTNNLTKVEKYNAHVYIKQNDKGALIAYYYVDEFIMDSILSTTLTYTSRKVYSNFFGFLVNRKPWETYQWSYTNTDTLEYKNQTSSWEQWIPFYNLIFLSLRQNQTFQMPRIEAVDFSNMQDYYNVTKQELDSEFINKTPNFTSIKNNSRYKVWAFALQDGVSFDGSILGTVQTEFYNTADTTDARNLKVIEIVYQTDEKIYTTVGNHINLKISVQDKIDGIANEDNDPNGINPLFISFIVFMISLAFGLFNGSLLTKKGLNLGYIIGALILSVIVFILIGNIPSFLN